MRELQVKYGMSAEDAGQSRTSSVILFGDRKEQSEAGGKKRDIKGKQKTGSVSGAKSVASGKSKYKNYNKYIKCDQCEKEMRSDALKGHRGSRFCKKE